MNTRVTEYLKRVQEKLEEGSTIESEYISAREKLTVKCPVGHLRVTTANDIMSRKGYICRECSPAKTAKKSDSEVSTKLLEHNLVMLEDYKGMLTKVRILNNVCGHEYQVTPSDVIRGRVVLCPMCKTNYNFEEELCTNNLIALSNYIDRKTNVLVRNSTCGHEYFINPGHFLYDSIGKTCTICGTIKTRFFSKLVNLELVEDYKTAQVPIMARNTSCGHEYEVTPNNLVYADSGMLCRMCFPSLSRPEVELKEFITENYNGWIIENDRIIIAPKELDIVLPDLGLAFEMNGEYWHSEEKRGNKYHLDKTEAVESVEYQLIHITDLQWNSKQNIIKSRILALLGNSTKVMARKCVLKKLESMPRDFLLTNHIQGVGAPTGINYGLFHNNELVAVMTFKQSSLHGAHYELVRYCSLLNTTVIGGASRLLRAFEREYGNPIIMSYAARDWSTGKLYKALGFQHLKNTEPGYHYFKGNDTFSRQMFQKAKLQALFPDVYEDAKSEKHIMLEAGYHRYYDSGNMVFIKNKLESSI